MTNLSRISEKARDELERVFVYGADSQDPPVQMLVRALTGASETPMNKAEIFGYGIEALRNCLFELGFIGEPKGKTQRTFPLTIPVNTHGFRAMPHLARGRECEVYTLHTNQGTFAVGIVRQKYDTLADAHTKASTMQRAHLEYNELFSTIPDFIPKEQCLVIKHPVKGYAVMFIRDFVEGPLRDIFSFEKHNLVEMMGKNPEMHAQFLMFVKITYSCKQVLAEEHFDLVGYRNLVIAGAPSHERLVLIEAHPEGENMGDPERDTRLILDRLSYLKDCADEIEFNQAKGSTAE